MLPNLYPLLREPVTRPIQVDAMRIIRNTGLGGYSGDNTVITAKQQYAWWRAMTRAQSVQAWLYYGPCLHDHPCTHWARWFPVGFGLLLRRHGGIWSPSAGLLPCARGLGYGTRIVTDLADTAINAGIPLTAVARKDNPAACKTHVPALWEQVADDDQTIVYRTRGRQVQE